MAISFTNADRKLIVKNKTKLKEQIAAIFHFNNIILGELSYIFCSDEYLLEMNQRFLRHDFYTDIITFDLSTTGSPLIGEVYISIDRVRDNATQLRLSFNEETHRVIFHGALHLCGFKDKRKADKLAMRTAENFWLAHYFK